MNDFYIEDGSVAVSASRREEVMVVWLTVRLTVAFKKVLSTQFVAAVSADKVLRVPCSSQRCHHLQKKINSRFED